MSAPAKKWSMNNSCAIKTTGLSYHYSKNVQTLFGINLSIERGSIYGFLGPNGSGKTTTLSLLLGLLPNQRGDIEIFGQHLHASRINILKKIGSLIETPSLYSHLTAKENLEIYRPFYGVKRERIKEVLQIVGLEDTGKKTTKKFSLGMKQRLAIAVALLPNPELLILDEPSNGLDPGGIIELRQLVKDLNQRHGMTIVISSHILSEVEKMVSHLGIIYKGKMLFEGTLPQLHALRQKDARLLIKTSDNTAALPLLATYGPQMAGDAIAVHCSSNNDITAIARSVMESNLDLFLLQPEESNLEQLFINLTTDAS